MSNEPKISESQKLNGPALDMALDDILRLSKEDVPRLPAAAFIALILTPLTERNIPLFRENWMRIAGALQRPIEVVDASGESIHRAPSIVMQIPARVSESHRDSLSEISEQAAKYSEYNGRMGQMYMADNMRGRNIPVIGHLQTMLDWNVLAQKLDQPAPFAGLAEVKTSSSSTGAVSDDAPMFTQSADEDF